MGPQRLVVVGKTRARNPALMKTVAIIQARTGSTRLPGKVLLDLACKPLLAHVVERAQRIQLADAVVVATTTAPADDRIEALCARYAWRCFRGEEMDVLDRYYQAAREVNARDVVRITSDCPLFCPRQADRVIRHHLDSRADYTHNATVWGGGTPVGTGCEVLTFAALEASWREGKEPHHREHVTDYVYERGERFRTETVPAPPELWRPQYRLTVDTLEDLQLIRKIYGRLYRPGQIIDLADVIRLLDHEPELLEINRHVVQKQSSGG